MRVAAWFLAVSYGIAAPLTAFLEYRGQTLSQRFDLPPELIYIVCAVQALCAVGVLKDQTRVASAVALTVITIGAMGAHLRIGSPQTALGAVFYAAVQVWFAVKGRRLA